MDTLFTIYALAWGAVVIVFYILDKRAKSIAQRKRLSIFSGVAILLLMIGFVAMTGWIAAILVLLVVGPIFIFLSEKYTCFCEKCGKRVLMFGKDVNYCPKCGGSLIK